MKILADTIRNIYNHLQDNESRLFFENRLLYTLTGDYKYIQRMIAGLPQKIELDKAIEFCKNHEDKVVIYGAGNDLLILTDLYPDFKIQLICDKSEQKQKSGWRGIPVISPDELLKRKDDVYVAVNTSAFYKEIVQFLLDNGFREDNIINLGAITNSLYSAQYFDKDIIKPQPGEIFIDGGCFDCGTDKEFIKWCSGDYERIYAFEPDTISYERCLEECEKENIKKIEIYNKGLWNRKTKLSFQQTGRQGSSIGGGEEVISTTSIDAIVGDKSVSFIKLDVEGAELEALQGAEQTISKNHPRLAICIYHKPEDIVTIPEYILSLHNDYKLYIRHYRIDKWEETIVYAL